jgi:hypothetical protein
MSGLHSLKEQLHQSLEITVIQPLTIFTYNLCCITATILLSAKTTRPSSVKTFRTYYSYVYETEPPYGT